MMTFRASALNGVGFPAAALRRVLKPRLNVARSAGTHINDAMRLPVTITVLRVPKRMTYIVRPSYSTVRL